MSEWTELETRASHTFYTSWDWIGSWLESLPPGVRLQLVRIELNQRTVALGILGSRTNIRSKFIPLRGLFLNATGDSILDDITIEHNGMLIERTHERAALEACTKLLLSLKSWDELVLSGVTETSTHLTASLPRDRSMYDCRPCYVVDLDVIRASGRRYVDQLGNNTRQHVRRSTREFEKLGPLSIDVADTVSVAHAYLGELRVFHDRYWQSRGNPGSFASPFSQVFHERLIDRCMKHQTVQLLRVRAGDRAIGYLYNFVHDGRVVNYQTGFDYSLVLSKHHRPGLVCHALAIEFNQRAGARIYDFLAGDVRFKSNLGNRTESLYWIVVRRDRFRFALESTLRWGKVRISRLLRVSAPNALVESGSEGE
jgi:CelD/BcsL family acetyltransferase involved in cellulose biosynthesis